MNQGGVITYRVDSRWCNHRYEQCPKKMHEARNLNSTQSKCNVGIFDRLNQGFGGVANTIKKFEGIVAAEVIGGGTFGAK